MTQPLIRLRGVSKVYGRSTETAVHALSNVDLDIYDGEFVAIVGPSGGGKSTLLSILGLLDTPTAGEYELEGTNVSGFNDRELTGLRSQQFGFVFQAFHLLNRRAVRDSVELGLQYLGIDHKTRQATAEEALVQVGLETKADALASTLSGGQQQRVAIARATATRSRVILADEPTGNLDSETGQRILTQLSEIHQSGTTVIVVTHSEDVALRAERTIRVEDGRITSAPGGHLKIRPSDPLPHSATHRVRGRDVVRDAFLSVSSRRLSTFGLALAVAIAVAFMILTIGLSASTSAQVSDAFNATRNREVTVALPDDQTNHSVSLDEAVRRASALAGVDAIAGMADYGDVTITGQDANAQVTMRGVTGDFIEAADAKVAWASQNVHSLSLGTVLLGRSLSQQLHLAPLAASPTVLVNGTPLSVIGIIESSGRYPLLAGQLVASNETAEQLGTAAHTAIAIKTVNGAAPQVGKQVAVTINPFEPDSLLVQTPVDPSTLRRQVEWGLQVALGGFTALAAVVAIITLANAISMSVVSRTGEFGLRRAVGARGRHLAELVAAEALMIGLAGGVGGLVLGLLSLFGFTISQGWQPVFDIRLAPLAVAAGAVLAILSSIIGATRAARLSPAAALRGE